jgi:ribosomal protein S1
VKNFSARDDDDDGDDDGLMPNALMPNVQGKVIATRIIAVDARNGVATALTGLRGTATYKLSELDRVPAVGDVVEARVTWMNNPAGAMDLEVRGLARRRSLERVWQELLAARDAGTTVKGRILNAVNGGYAVGIAGVIAFLPSRAYRGRAPPTTAERAYAEGGDADAPVVGELLGFKILKMTSSGEHYKNVVVSGPIGGGANERRAAAKARNEKARSWGTRRRGGGGDDGDATTATTNEDASASDGEEK